MDRRLVFPPPARRDRFAPGPTIPPPAVERLLCVWRASVTHARRGNCERVRIRIRRPPPPLHEPAFSAKEYHSIILLANFLTESL